MQLDGASSEVDGCSRLCMYCTYVRTGEAECRLRGDKRDKTACNKSVVTSAEKGKNPTIITADKRCRERESPKKKKK